MIEEQKGRVEVTERKEKRTVLFSDHLQLKITS